jgi:hypothetical protein
VLSVVRTARLRHIIETHQRLVTDLCELRSTILPRLQQVEHELLSAKLGRLFAELHVAIELTVRQGLEAAASIEKGCRGMVAPLPRGKAGGLERAKRAWRYSDGTFMPQREIDSFWAAEYERYAKGGRARAASAQRAPDGTFLRV